MKRLLLAIATALALMTTPLLQAKSGNSSQKSSRSKKSKAPGSKNRKNVVGKAPSRKIGKRKNLKTSNKTARKSSISK